MVCSILSLDSQASLTKRPTPFIFTHQPTYLSTPIFFLSQCVDQATNFRTHATYFLSKLHFTISRKMGEKMIVSHCCAQIQMDYALSKRFLFQLGLHLISPLFSFEWMKIIAKLVRSQRPLLLFFHSTFHREAVTRDRSEVKHVHRISRQNRFVNHLASNSRLGAIWNVHEACAFLWCLEHWNERWNYMIDIIFIFVSNCQIHLLKRGIIKTPPNQCQCIHHHIYFHNVFIQYLVRLAFLSHTIFLFCSVLLSPFFFILVFFFLIFVYFLFSY